MADTPKNAPEEQTSAKPDWTINELYRNSWLILKKHKVLWLFGMAMGAGYSSNSSSNFDQQDTETLQNLFRNGQESSGQDLSMVLGTATSSFAESFGALFAAVPPYIYVIGAIEIFMLIVAGIVISIIYHSWAEAGLLEGLQTAIAGGTVSIRETSEKAYRSIQDIAWVRIIPMLFFFLAVFLFVIVIFFSFMGPFGMLLMPLGVLFFFVIFIFINFSQIWAVRKVVTEHIPAKQALREGYYITQKKFWPMLGLGILNTILGIVLMVALFAPLFGFLLGGILTIENDAVLGVTMFIAAGLFSLLFIFGSEILTGIINVFKNSVWSLAYKNIKGKYDK